MHLFFKGVRKDVESYGTSAVAATPAKKAADDDDIDLFGSDEETEESKRIKAERVAAYAAKKEKSNIYWLFFITLIANFNLIY